MKKIYVLNNLNHPALKYFYKNSPPNIKFIYSNNLISNFLNQSTLQLSNKKFKNSLFLILYQIYKRVLNFLKIPTIIPILPSKNLNYDFILTSNLILSNKRFILFLEYIGSLVNFRDDLLESPLCLRILKKIILSNRCAFVFTWSKSARLMIFNYLDIPKQSQNKFKVLYPTMLPSDLPDRKSTNTNVKLLFISSINKKDKEFNFYMKGGKLLLQAFEKLKPKYDNLKLTFIGYVPKKIKDYYSKFADINFFLRKDYKDIINLYKESDIFIFPSYGDYYGFTFIEAMSFGLPIICLNNNSAAPELVIDGFNGFVIDTNQKFLRFPFFKYSPTWIKERKYIENLKNNTDKIGLIKLIEKIDILINNPDLRKKLGLNGRKRLVEGKISLNYQKSKFLELFR